MDNFRAPPPYSETDIYSNPDRSPRSPQPDLSRSTTQTEDASQASTNNSIIYTPPYTPTDSFDNHASAARLYFDSRPLPRRVSSRIVTHEIAIEPNSTPDDLPYLADFADRDITIQDWATFVNYVIPHHMNISNGRVASEKMKAEVLDRRMHRLTLSSQDAMDMSVLDAQLNGLQPSKLGLSSEQANDAAAVVLEWNSGFFKPRGIRILVTMMEPELPVATPKDMTEQPGERPIPYRPGWQAGRSDSAPNSEALRRNHDPRGWGWGSHGPGHRGLAGRASRRERIGCEQATPDGLFGRGRSGRYGRFSGRLGAESGFHVGRVTSAEKDSFRVGPMVADKSGFRIGNVLVANDEGFKLGGMRFGNSYHPDLPRGESWSTECGPGMEDRADKKDRHRSRSRSTCSFSSDGTSESAESEGSLPDVGDLKARQLPAMKQSLVEWLNHPDQPVSKVAMKSLKNELKVIKSIKMAKKPEGEELVEMKAEIKALVKTFREMKRNRRVQRKAMRKERRRETKMRAKERRKDHRAARAARKSRRKGKGKEMAANSQSYGPGEVGFIPTIPGIPGFSRGLPGMHMPSGFHGPDSFLGIGFNPLAQGTQRSTEEVASIQAKRQRLEAEADRILNDADTKWAEAEQTRKQAYQERDEKATLKLLDVAKDLDVEVEKLFEETDRLLAEVAQLEEYLVEIGSGGDVPPRDCWPVRRDTAEDRAYIRKMRQSSGVAI